MKFTTYSEAHLKSLKKDELIDLYRQLEDILKSEIAENETTMNYIRAANIKITEQHKKDIIKAKKEAIKEFVNFIKEQMPLDICSGIEACEEINSLYEQFLLNLKTKPLTNSDRIRNLSDEELADFINDIASDSIATISYGTQEYTEIWEDREETIKYLKAEIEKSNDKTLNRNTDNYER